MDMNSSGVILGYTQTHNSKKSTKKEGEQSCRSLLTVVAVLLFSCLSIGDEPGGLMC